jgi:hypothetical protein
MSRNCLQHTLASLQERVNVVKKTFTHKIPGVRAFFVFVNAVENGRGSKQRDGWEWDGSHTD